MGVAKGVGRGASRPGKPQIFCIIVNRTDAPHFEYLRRNAPSVDHKWGLRDYDRKAWEEVKPNDLVYMWTYDSATIPLCGRVAGTAHDPDVARVWIREEWLDRTWIIYFSHLRHINIIFKDFSIYTRGLDFSRTLFRAHEDSVDRILKGWPVNDPIFVPPGASPPVDLVSPPDAVEYDTVRAIRDTAGARKLKELYGNRCQVCGYALEAASGSIHSEAHHLRPLHEGGADTPDNMVVLCPRHHAELDYGAILVDESGAIAGRGAQPGARLSFKGSHRLDIENVRHAMKK